MIPSPSDIAGERAYPALAVLAKARTHTAAILRQEQRPAIVRVEDLGGVRLNVFVEDLRARGWRVRLVVDHSTTDRHNDQIVISDP